MNHKEPDHIPFDLGGTVLTTIHVDGYRKLRRYLDLLPVEVQVMAQAGQFAAVNEDLDKWLETDVRLVLPGMPTGSECRFRDHGDYEAYTARGPRSGCETLRPKDYSKNLEI